MVGPSAERTIEWEGGSLAELVAMMQAAALPVRIEVIARGTTDTSAGEVHLLAGGLADAFAGSLRRDDALAALQRLEGARYRVEARLPDPETGSLSTPGPQEGSLKDRPLASLMRYCEDYVLTCRVEVWRGQDRAVIGYRRGEIISTTVGGAEGSELLPEVLAWTDGSYEIVLPAPPQAPVRKGAARASEPFAKTERKRHGTLPLATPSGGDGPAAAVSSGASTTPASPTTAPAPTRPAVAAGTAKPATASPPPATSPLRGAALQPAPASQASPPQQPPTRAPAQPAQAGPPAKPAQPEAQVKPAVPVARAAGQGPVRSPSAAAQQQPMVRQPAGTAMAAQPSPATAASTLGRSGGPPAASPEQLPGPAAQTGQTASTKQSPLKQGAARVAGAGPTASGQAPARQPTQPAHGSPPGPAQPAQGSSAAPAQTATPQAGAAALATGAAVAAKTPARAPTPAMGSRTGSPPKEPLAVEPTARGTPPVPLVPLIPPPSARPTATPPPLTQAKPSAAKPAAASAEGSAAEKGSPQESATSSAPSAQPAASTVLPTTPPPFHLAQPARPHKPGTVSNDLKPASGTIQAKSRHPNHLPPAAAPIEIAEEPNPPPDPRTSSQAMASAQPSQSRRMRVARRGGGDHSFKVYILIGLAIGAGVVVAYWAYWYLPFWHH